MDLATALASCPRPRYGIAGTLLRAPAHPGAAAPLPSPLPAPAPPHGQPQVTWGHLPATAGRGSDQPWETELLGEAFWVFFTSAQLGFDILVTGARNKLTFSLPICHTVAQRSGAAPPTPAAVYCKRTSSANESPWPGPHSLQVIRRAGACCRGNLNVHLKS